MVPGVESRRRRRDVPGFTTFWTTSCCPGHIDSRRRRWCAWSNNAGSLRLEHTRARDGEDTDPTQEASSLLEDEDETDVEVAATTSEDLAKLAPRGPPRYASRSRMPTPPSTRTSPAWFSDNCPLPRLS
ncbi:hypothetical protein, partial [Lapillicoccus sp.]|uniref:hypothetical protein n=1 Tax=Lapillicoccus sp. TaxID=1909287 RepID=UPI003983A72D